MDNLEGNPYRSPVRLVLHAGEPMQPFSAQTLSRARKKLLAELSLGGDELTIGEATYTRNDISTLLQDISEEQWTLHCLVFTIPSLLDFLEKGVPDLEAMERELRPYRFKPGFPEFISASFALSFRDASARMIRSVEPARLALLMPFHDFIMPQDEELAYARLRRYLSELLQRIQTLDHENFEEQRSTLNFLYSPAWINFVNALPSSLSPERDQVVQALLSLVVRFQRKATWQFLDQLCQRILLINSNAELRARVQEAATIVRANVHNAATRRQAPGRPAPAKSEGPSVGRIIFSIFWVIVIIVRIGSTDSCRSRSYTDDYTSNLKMADRLTRPLLRQQSSKANENELLRTLDSLSAHRQPGSTDAPDSGEPPFAGHSELPERFTEDNFVIVNSSGKDMIFFWFTAGHLLLDSTHAPYAVFIRKGDSTSFPMSDGRNSRFAAAFGDGWSRLKKPAIVHLQNRPEYVGGSDDPYATATESGTFPIRSYFRKPLSEQPFLSKVIRLSYFAGGDNGEEKLYEPAHRNELEEKGRIRFVQEGGKIKAEGGGRYYLSLVARGD